MSARQALFWSSTDNLGQAASDVLSPSAGYLSLPETFAWAPAADHGQSPIPSTELATPPAAMAGDNLEAMRAAPRYIPPSHTVITTPSTPATSSPTLPSGLTVSADRQTVVVLDTGISSTVGNLIYQYDFYSNDSNASSSATHGSIVASQVLAADSDVNIVMLKVAADGSDSISLTAVDAALDWVAKYASTLNIAAVNLSFGASATVSSETATTLSDEFATLSALDVAVVVAAGNSGAKAGVSALASDSHVIAVSASDGSGNFASFSNRDADLTDLVADGVDIATRSGTVSGTSFSAPLVAGAIAEVKDAFYTAYGRELTVDEAMLLLQATADAMNTSGEVAGTSSQAGQGYVQLDLADALSTIGNLAELKLIGIAV